MANRHANVMHNQDENSAPKPRSPWKRKELWFVFSACYLSFPAAVLLALNGDITIAFFWIVCGGILGAGFTLSKLFIRRMWPFVICGIVFSLFIAALHWVELSLFILWRWRGPAC